MASIRIEGENLSHASSEQPALKPAASQNPLSASEPWNLVADGYAETTMLVFEQFADQAIAASTFPVGSTTEFWDNMVKGSAPIQMMKKSITSVRGEPVEPHSENMGEALWREKELLALDYLKERLTELPTELTLDAWLGVGVK